MKNMMNVASCLILKTITIGGITIKSDAAKCYKGKLFVLTDDLTSSGAESLTAILKEQSNAVVIGQCTAGDCGSRGCNFKTSHGIVFITIEQPKLIRNIRV